jgi:hypothetical protein
MLKSSFYSAILHSLILALLYTNFKIQQPQENKSNEVRVGLMIVDNTKDILNDISSEPQDDIEPLEINDNNSPQPLVTKEGVVKPQQPPQEVIKSSSQERGKKENVVNKIKNPINSQVQKQPRTEPSVTKEAQYKENSVKKKEDLAENKPINTESLKAKQEPPKQDSKLKQDSYKELAVNNQKKEKEIIDNLNIKDTKSIERPRNKENHQEKSKIQNPAEASVQKDNSIYTSSNKKDSSINFEANGLSTREKLNIQNQIKLCYQRAVIESRRSSEVAIVVKANILSDGTIIYNFDDQDRSQIYNSNSGLKQPNADLSIKYFVARGNAKRALDLCNPLRNIPSNKEQSLKEVLFEFEAISY